MKWFRVYLASIFLLTCAIAAQAQSLGNVTGNAGSWSLDIAPDINDDFTKIYGTPFLSIGNQTIFSTERALTAGTCITGTDAGANSTYTVAITSACIDASLLATDSVSADELNATGVEAELEAIIELADLQGSLTLAGDVDGAHGSNDLDEASVETELEAVLDVADLQGFSSVLTEAEAAAAYQPLDADLTSWAGVTRASGFDTFTATPTMANLGSLLTNDASGWVTFGQTPSSANFAALVSDETGTGLAVLATDPDITISASTEGNIESAIDTLANLASIQGFAFDLDDNNLDEIWGWDDGAATFDNFSLADITTEAVPANGDFVLIYGAEGDFRKVDWANLPGAGSGVDSFLELTDTPDDYTTFAGDCVKVNGTEDGLEFDTCAAGSGDDLGNHTATENLKMTTFDIDFGTGDVVIDYSANDLAFTGVTGDYSFDDTVGVTGDVVASVNVTATAGDVTSGDDLISGDDVLLSNAGVINFNAGDCTLTEGTDTLTIAGTCVLVTENAGLQIGASVPFSDSAGTLTLQNVDALDATSESTIEVAIDTLDNVASIGATTESTIEAALDTLANVTSIGGDVTAGGDFISTDDIISGDDVLLSDAGVINFNAGDCTLTEGTNTLTIAGNCTLISEIILPDGDNTRDLGSTGATWATAHINSIELADGTANTITATGGALSIEGVALLPDTTDSVDVTNLAPDSVGASELNIGDAEAEIEGALDTLANVISIGGDVTAGGDFISTDDLISGDDVLLSNAGVINFGSGDCTLTEGTDTLTIGGTCTLVSEVIVPDGDNTRDLGSAAATWATAHINSVELANGTTHTLTATGGNLVIKGNVNYRAGGTNVAIADGGCNADDAATCFANIKQAASETATGVVEAATTAEAETGTDTSRYVTPAGVLAAVTGKKPIWIPAGSLIPRTTNGCAITDIEAATNDIMQRVCSFTQTELGAGFWIRMPDTWNEGTLTFVAEWSHPSTTTNFGVVWQWSCVAVSNDDAIDASLGTQQEIADTGGTTDDMYTTSESPATTCAGSPAAGDMVYIEVEREPGNGSDTLAVDARLHGFTAYYVDNAFVEP